MLGISYFYKHSKMTDGHLGKCKDCCKSDNTKDRNKNIDKYRKYDRDRFQNDPIRREKTIANSNRRREMGLDKAAKRKWTELNRYKKNAQTKVRRAIKRGVLVRPDKCVSCGISGVRIEGHHHDYSKPLDVCWLCTRCHGEEHRRIRDIERELK